MKVEEELCFCQNVVMVGSDSNLGEREMYLIDLNVLEMSGVWLFRSHPLYVEKICAELN